MIEPTIRASWMESCDIVDRLAHKRIALNMSQAELARRCAVSQPTISLIESKAAIPKLTTILEMATVLGVNVTFADEQEVGCLIPFECRVQDAFDRSAFPFDERTLRHIRTLFEEYGYAGVLQRGPVCELLGMEASGVSILFTKLKEAGILEPVPGLSRGNYRFVRGKFRHI